MAKFVAVLVACACVGLVAMADDPKPEKKADPEMIPDLSWSPTAGDRVVVNEPRSPGAISYLLFREFAKFRDANDEKGMSPLIESRSVVLLPKGTNVLVLKRYSPVPFVDMRPISSEEYAQELQSAVSRAGEKKTLYPVEVRVLDGEFKDQIRFIPEPDLARLIEKKSPPSVKAREKPKPKPIDPVARAKSLLRSGEALEKSGKTRGAADFYRIVVRDYPKSPEAKTATERLKMIKP